MAAYFRIVDKEIGSVSMKDALWFAKMKIVDEYDPHTPIEKQIEALPVVIDFQLSWRTAQKMKDKAESRRREFEHTQGFRSKSLDNYINILTQIVEAKTTALALCD